MTIAPLHRNRPEVKTCVHCASPVEVTARFCGECGAPGHHTHRPAGAGPLQLMPSAPPVQNVTPIGPVTAANIAAAPINVNKGFQFPHADANHFRASEPRTGQVIHEVAPSFATVSKKIQVVNPEVREELGKHMVLLARERIFLILHCLNFLAIHSLGFFLAIKAYTEYNADELTKTVISLTPLMFINTFGLVCLSPIKGTKAEIARLKERIKFLRFQVDYKNII